MFERCTEPARAAPFFARYEASHFSSGSIDPDHLLLGLLRESQGLAHRLLERHHVSPDALRQRVELRTALGPIVPLSAGGRWGAYGFTLRELIALLATTGGEHRRG